MQNASGSTSRRLAVFAGIVAACTIAAVVAVVLGVRGSDSAVQGSPDARSALTEARGAGRPTVVYLRGGQTRSGSQVAIAPAADPSRATPTLTPLKCARVSVGGGRGLCLARDRSLAAGYKAEVFGSDLRVRHSLALPGLASRARVSPDGRYGSVTLFVAGDSYAAAGSFSTRTTLVDLADASRIADLEQFTVTRGGRQVTAVDVNFWGVTFARGGDRFYATMATGGKTYLIEGSIGARTARALHENVECPSLSPDGTRIAYKRRTGSSSRPWRLTVLDLATMRETPLAEQRSVDDQAEWLDDGHVLYAVDGSTWSVPADGSGRPGRYIAGAGSPSVIRWDAAGR